MQAILRSWRLSLDLLRPQRLFGLFKSALKAFGKAALMFGKNFGLLVVIDMGFTLIFGDLFAKAGNLADPGKHPAGPILLLLLAQSVAWFLIVTAFFLLSRKDDDRDPKVYFRSYFFKYMQLLFFFSLVFIVALYALLATGITKMPAMPWGLLLFVKTLEYCIAFFWLDSSGNFIDLFKSIETGINTCFYNAPVIIFLVLIAWGFDSGIGFLNSVLFGKTAGHALLTGGPLNLATGDGYTLFTSLKIIFTKYLTFIIENFWLCLLLAFYRRKKSEQYVTSMFTRDPEINSG